MSSINSDTAIVFLQSPEVDIVTGRKLLIRGKCTEPQTEVLVTSVMGGDDGNRSFNQCITIELNGLLNKKNLVSALNHLVNRHQSLRMLFDIEKNDFLIFENLLFVYEEKKVDSKTQTFDSLLDKVVKDEVQFVFDLKQGPLFRTTLVSDGKLRNSLVLNLHHIISDGWSLIKIIEDLGYVYSSLQNNLDINELESADKYSDYVIADTKFRKSEDRIVLENYWINKFNDYSPVSPLPYDRPRPSKLTYKNGHISFPIEKNLFAKIKKLGKETKTKVLPIMASALEVVLAKRSGLKNFIIGIPTAGQPNYGFNNLIGHCVNILPIRVNIDFNQNYSNFLSNRKREYCDSFQHKSLTFGSLINKLKISRDIEDSPLIPILFNIDRPLIKEESFAELESEVYVNPHPYSSFELTLNLSRREDEIQIECFYNEALFNRETIESLLIQYTRVLEQLVLDHDIQLFNVDLFDRTEDLKKINKWNSTQKDFPVTTPLHKLIEESVKNYPNDKAIVYNGLSLSYEELNSKSNQLARYLLDQGLKKDEFAGVMLSRSPELIISILALMKIGVKYIPIDPNLPSRRISYMLEDSEAMCLVTSELVEKQLPNQIQTIYLEKIKDELDKYINENLNQDFGKDEILYAIYTSGSTGNPKGVLAPNKAVVNFLYSFIESPGFTRKDKIIAVTTISFDMACLEIFTPLICGACIVLADNQTIKDGTKLLQLIEKEQATMMQATPTSYKMMLASGWKENKRLRVICGAEPLSNSLAKEIMSRSKELWNLYGTTETTLFSTLKK
ncbi:MAG: condensation domain-containing protein [Bacteroidia bacterium]